MGKIDAESFETASANMSNRSARIWERVGAVWTAIAAQNAVWLRAPREVERPVISLPLQELLVRPGFGDAAVHEDNDLRILWDRVITMRREDDDLVRHLREERKDCALALRIQ